MAIWRTHVLLLLLFSYLITTCNHKYFTKFSCYCNFISFHLISSHFISLLLFFVFFIVPFMSLKYNTVFMFIWHVNNICLCELICFVQNVNTQHPISAICLNECWISQENETAGLQKDITCFFKGEIGLAMTTVECGLIIYIHETFLSQEVIIENVNTSWDYLCVHFIT